MKNTKIKDNFIINELDGLEEIYTNRIDRILVSRNKCLEIISNINNQNKIIYIPIDLDLDLFKYVTVEKINQLIEYCINKNVPFGIFPFSTPYYYDIFALRAKNWVNYNSQLKVQKLKKIIVIGSFFPKLFFYIPTSNECKKIQKDQIITSLVPLVEWEFII